MTNTSAVALVKAEEQPRIIANTPKIIPNTALTGEPFSLSKNSFLYVIIVTRFSIPQNTKNIEIIIAVTK